MGIRHRRYAIIVAVTVLFLGNTVTYASVDDFFQAALSGESAANREGNWDEPIWGQWDADKTSDKASDHMPSYSDSVEEELSRMREEQEKLQEEIPLEEAEEKMPKKQAKEQEASTVGESVEENENIATGTITVPEKTGLPTGRYVIIALLLAGAGGIGGYLLRHPAQDEADDDTELQG